MQRAPHKAWCLSGALHIPRQSDNCVTVGPAKLRPGTFHALCMVKLTNSMEPRKGYFVPDDNVENPHPVTTTVDLLNTKHN
jgi:hypothetical protein